MFEGVMQVSNRQSRSNTCPQLLIPSNQLEWVVSGVWPRNAVDMFLGHQFVSDIPKKDYFISRILGRLPTQNTNQSCY